MEKPLNCRDRGNNHPRHRRAARCTSALPPLLDWLVASPELQGPIRMLLLLLTGRTRTALPHLSGPGVQTIIERSVTRLPRLTKADHPAPAQSTRTKPSRPIRKLHRMYGVITTIPAPVKTYDAVHAEWLMRVGATVDGLLVHIGRGTTDGF